MSETHEGLRDGIETIWTEYTNEELRAAWNEGDQGHAEAVERGRWCVVIECDEYDAVSLSRLFVRNVFAIPTCCHYDGRTLSLYCGDAGSGAPGTFALARALVALWIRPSA